jgi:hypothetical protein
VFSSRNVAQQYRCEEHWQPVTVCLTTRWTLATGSQYRNGMLETVSS